MIRLKAEIYSPDGAEIEAGEAVFEAGSDAAAALGRALRDRAHPAIREAFQP